MDEKKDLVKCLTNFMGDSEGLTQADMLRSMGMDDKEFLEMLDEMLLAPDTIIRKEWVSRLVDMFEEKGRENERLTAELKLAYILNKQDITVYDADTLLKEEGDG